ncbi:MAG: hypothetical protein V4538_04810 [Bacteroidota bacterium]
MHWKVKVIVFLILSAIVISYPFFAIKYFETEKALKITAKYFLGPTFICLCLFGPRFYFKKVKPLDSYLTQSKLKEKARDIFSIIIMICYSSIIFCGMFFSLIITTNSFGKSQLVIIRQTIIKYRPEVTKNGRLRHYIDISNPYDNDNIHLEVYREYKPGEIFEKEMKYGQWGILYSKE